METLVKKKKSTRKTVHISVRVPENVVKAIEILVELGFFKDKSDFVNYALQETLKEYLSNVRIKMTSELVEKYFELLEKASPKLSEKEVLKILEEVRK
ncbi:hypothetical protein QDY65_04560 [Pyrococcus kukulkanii]